MNIRKDSKICRKQVNDKAKQRYAKESVLSVLYDVGATSTCGSNSYDFILTDEQSNKVFHMAIVTTAKANVKSNIFHNLRETIITMDMVPVLKHNSLVTAIKFENSTYIKVLKLEEVLIYYGNEVNCEHQDKQY